MKYKLNSAETVAQAIYHVPQTKQINGRNVIVDEAYIRLNPNVVYESDDDAMIGFFRTYRKKVNYTAQLEDVLKAHNVPYKVELCKTCGGRKRKIFYQLVEVFE